MEEFSITCTTCGSHLKVRDANLVGQILACPKCNAMVMVESPEEQLAIGSPVGIDSQAITRDAIDPPVESETPSEFEQRDVKPMTPFEGDPDATDAAPPQADWQSSSTKGYRQIVMIAGVAIFAIVSAAALFGLFLRSSLHEEEAVATSTTPTETEVAPSEDPTNSTPDVSPETTTQQTTEDTSTNIANPENLDPSVPGSSQPNITPDASVESSTEPENNIDTPLQEASPAEEPSERTMLSPAGPTNPLAAPNGGRIFDDNPRPDDQEPSEPAMTELPASLMDGVRGIFSDIDPEQIKPKTRPKQSVRFEPIPEVSDEFPSPAPTIVIGRERMKALPGIDIKDQKLAMTVDTFSKLSSIPISLDISSLDSAGIRPSAPCSGRYLETTIGEALDQVVATAGCKLVETQPGFLAVHALDQRVNAFVAPAMKLDDFQDTEAIEAMIRQIILFPEDSFKIDGDAPNAVIDFTGTAATRWQIALVLDALRVSRKLAPRIPTEFSERWLTENEPPAWRLPLEQELNLEGHLTQPLAHWVQQAAASHNALALIDWPNAWAGGMATHKKMLPWVSGVSIRDLSDELLSPHGLEFFDIGRGVWIVSTPRAMAVTPSIVLYSQTITENHDEFLQRFAASLDLESQSQLRAVIDPVSNRLICRMPRFILAQVSKLFDESE